MAVKASKSVKASQISQSKTDQSHTNQSHTDHPDLAEFSEPDLHQPPDLRQDLRQDLHQDPCQDLCQPNGFPPGSHHIVEFNQAKTDRDLLCAIEAALSTGTYGSFSDLCKQALQQLLLSSQVNPAEGQTSLHLIALQQQMMDLQRQVAKLEGAMSMQRLMSLQQLEQKLEHQLMQLDQRIAQHTTDLAHRLDRLESTGVATLPNLCAGLGSDIDAGLGVDLCTDLPLQEPQSDPIDPLLSRLVPLLEDF